MTVTEPTTQLSAVAVTYSDTLVTVQVHTPDEGDAYKNLYVYCANNPINFIDPLGFCGSNGASVPTAVLSGVFTPGVVKVAQGKGAQVLLNTLDLISKVDAPETGVMAGNNANPVNPPSQLNQRGPLPPKTAPRPVTPEPKPRFRPGAGGVIPGPVTIIVAPGLMNTIGYYLTAPTSS